MNTPKISIVMNCFNGEEHLREALDSIFQQTYQDWEVIFWDNCSIDSSASIANSYGEKIRYFRSNELTSLGKARRLAVEKAVGEWVCFLDVDDRWHPKKLEAQIRDLEMGDYLFAYAGVCEIKRNGEKIREVTPKLQTGFIFGSLITNFELNMVTPIFNREKAEILNIRFDDAITASEEFNFFMRLAYHGNALVQHKVLGDYRLHSGSLTFRSMGEWANERRITLRQLETSFPDIKKLYANELEEANAKGDYYEAMYLMSKGNLRDARALLKPLTSVNYKYRLLYYASFHKQIWSLIHSDYIKRVIFYKIQKMLGER